MNAKRASLATVVMLAGAVTTAAQQPPPAQAANPAAGCTATPAQIEANKDVAMEFFRTTGADWVALRPELQATQPGLQEFR